MTTGNSRYGIPKATEIELKVASRYTQSRITINDTVFFAAKCFLTSRVMISSLDLVISFLCEGSRVKVLDVPLLRISFISLSVIDSFLPRVESYVEPLRSRSA
jgi:hypothetical protein